MSTVDPNELDIDINSDANSGESDIENILNNEPALLPLKAEFKVQDRQDSSESEDEEVLRDYLKPGTVLQCTFIINMWYIVF